MSYESAHPSLEWLQRTEEDGEGGTWAPPNLEQWVLGSPKARASLKGWYLLETMFHHSCFSQHMNYACFFLFFWFPPLHPLHLLPPLLPPPPSPRMPLPLLDCATQDHNPCLCVHSLAYLDSALQLGQELGILEACLGVLCLDTPMPDEIPHQQVVAQASPRL